MTESAVSVTVVFGTASVGDTHTASSRGEADMTMCMAALPTVLAVLLLPGPAARTQDERINCTSPSLNQWQLDQCAGRDFEAVEDELSALYRLLVSKYDARNRALLEAAQRSWRAWRDSECDYETNGT